MFWTKLEQVLDCYRASVVLSESEEMHAVFEVACQVQERDVYQGSFGTATARRIPDRRETSRNLFTIEHTAVRLPRNGQGSG